MYLIDTNTFLEAMIDEMKTGLDFDDALQSYVARKFNLKILSFDKHFDGVEGLSRLRPLDIINLIG